MAKNPFTEIIEKSETDRDMYILNAKDELDIMVKRETQRIETEFLQRFEDDVVDYTQQQLVQAQQKLLEYLTNVSSQIICRSEDMEKRKNSSKPYAEKIRVNFMYGTLQPENPSRLGIFLPVPSISPDNGAKRLVERIKAVTLEVILWGKGSELLNVKSVSSLANSYLGAFIIDFSKQMCLSEKRGLTKKYSEVSSLEFLICRAFNNDSVLKEAGIQYIECDGLTLDRISWDGMIRKERDALPAIPDIHKIGEYYILDDSAIDLIFGLESTQSNYKKKHDQARQRFNEELKTGTFRDIFNDFDRIESEGCIYYDRRKIEQMLAGEVETIGSTAGPVNVRCVYAVPVQDERTMVRFFPCGAYEEADAIRKYNLTSQKIFANFEDEGQGDPRKKDRVRIVTPAGATTTYYRKEDIQYAIER